MPFPQPCMKCNALTFIRYGGMWCPACQKEIDKAELEQGAKPKLPLSVQMGLKAIEELKREINE